MGCFMNILWLMFGGIITAVEYLIASLLMMFTIIGIPFGMQTLKMASLALWPFGKEVRSGAAFGFAFRTWDSGYCCASPL